MKKEIIFGNVEDKIRLGVLIMISFLALLFMCIGIAITKGQQKTVCVKDDNAFIFKSTECRDFPLNSDIMCQDGYFVHDFPELNHKLVCGCEELKDHWILGVNFPSCSGTGQICLIKLH